MCPSHTPELLNSCKKSDLEAFRTLVYQYSDFAYALAYRLLYNKEDAEDAVQEGFIRVWKNLDSYNLNKKFSTWMYTIVTNICYDLLRKRTRQRSIVSDDCPEDFDCEELQLQPESGEIRPYIERAVDGLPLRQRVIFILRDFQDLSVKDVADILQISENAVKVNLYHARKNLREQLKEIL